jgi:6-phosphogluconolactonase (cycloisomerase 2 family)
MIKWLTRALFCSLPAAGAWADGAVYAMTNALGNNEVLVYHRGSNGNLSPTTPIQTMATGGGGSGLQLATVDSLGSAGSVQLDPDHRLLFVVNTESAKENNGMGAYNTDCQQGTITSFRVESDGTLTFADRVFSGGLFPNSLTVTKRNRGFDIKGPGHDKAEGGNLLYVLNAGGPEPPAVCHLTPDTANTPNITGFKVDRAGHMIPLDSTQPIDPGPPSSTSGVNCPPIGFTPPADFLCGLNPPSFPRSPAQVRFTPDGDQLLVTVKGTNTIYVFRIDEDGTADDHPTIMQAPGPALPSFFGFTFDKTGRLLVTELFGTATSIPALGAGALSSFTITNNGNLLPISSHVGDGGTAACWIALEPRKGKYAYVSNNLSANISSYTVANNGSVTLLNGTAASGNGPNDLAVAVDDKTSFLYVVDAGAGMVGAFRINADGSLTPLMGGSGLPTTSAQGLAAF